MRFSVNWLKQWVNISETAEQLSEQLTMAGLEVEGIEPYGQGLGDVIVAEVLSVRNHPAADRLFLSDRRDREPPAAPAAAA